MGPRRSNKTKNPPILSHEFFIQNHADIVSCVAMVFVIGLMFQATSPVASMFVAMQHNVSLNNSVGEEVMLYTCGKRDVFSVFFYFLICVVVHAVIQEYILDKMNRKLHLSKVKHSKFNESGQLMVFYIASVIWGADIILREGYVTGISQLWDGYPKDHATLPFIVKFFFIIQISYWLHCLPELYFQKVKKEEMAGRIQYITLYLVFIVAAFFLNFNRVAMCILVLHYLVEFVFHVARLCHFSEKADLSANVFMVFNILFVLVRLGTITLAVLTFWYGLEQTSQPNVDVASGNFNTQLIRINCLAAVCLMQAWLMWNFITFQLRKLRERSSISKKSRSPSKKKPHKGTSSDDELNSLPEVDQNSIAENGSLKSRVKAKKGQ